LGEEKGNEYNKDKVEVKAKVEVKGLRVKLRPKG
jgi:hypothetical protein